MTTGMVTEGMFQRRSSYREQKQEGDPEQVRPELFLCKDSRGYLKQQRTHFT